MLADTAWWHLVISQGLIRLQLCRGLLDAGDRAYVLMAGAMAVEGVARGVGSTHAGTPSTTLSHMLCSLWVASVWFDRNPNIDPTSGFVCTQHDDNAWQSKKAAQLVKQRPPKVPGNVLPIPSQKTAVNSLG